MQSPNPLDYARDNKIIRELPCRHCNHGLYGHDAAGQCPACGQPVADSIHAAVRNARLVPQRIWRGSLAVLLVAIPLTIAPAAYVAAMLAAGQSLHTLADLPEGAALRVWGWRLAPLIVLALPMFSLTGFLLLAGVFHKVRGAPTMAGLALLLTVLFGSAAAAVVVSLYGAVD